MKTISYVWYCLRGNIAKRDFFGERVPVVLRAALALFPEWLPIIHHDDAVVDHPYFPVLVRLQAHGVVRLVGHGTAKTPCESMLWRLTSLFDANAEWQINRDFDSLPSPRERWAVESFLNSGQPMHLINDCPSHQAIMGGMIGFHVPTFLQTTGIRSYQEVLDHALEHVNLESNGGDQDTMNEYFLPRLKGRFLLHGCDPEVHRAAIVPRPLSADVEPEVMRTTFGEYIGMVFQDAASPLRFYDRLATSEPIRQAERGVL